MNIKILTKLGDRIEYINPPENSFVGFRLFFR